jgi:hypothetical protein
LRQKPYNFIKFSVSDLPFIIKKKRKVQDDGRRNWIPLSQGMTKMNTPSTSPLNDFSHTGFKSGKNQYIQKKPRWRTY